MIFDEDETLGKQLGHTETGETLTSIEIEFTREVRIRMGNATTALSCNGVP